MQSQWYSFCFTGSWGHIYAMSCFVMKKVGGGTGGVGLQDTSWSLWGVAEVVMFPSQPLSSPSA